VLPHTTTELARERDLPGSDTFVRTHLMYINDLHRDAGVVSLNVEALKAFHDTITVGRSDDLLAESAAVAAYIERGGFESGEAFPFGRARMDLMEYYNYETLKIACAFELHLKARLLQRDFVVHEIDDRGDFRGLARAQRRRPVGKAELFEITAYHFDGAINYLPGLRETSLKFSLIAENQAYIEVLDLPSHILSLVQEYRRLRNMIHLPGDFPSTPYLSSLERPVAEILIEFMQSSLVDECEKLIARHQLNPAQLNRFRARNA
jgi:hypothetical protein